MSKQDKQTNGSFSYFSPTKNVSGGALFTSFNSKAGDIYLKVIPQIANNPNKLQNFDGKNPVNIKLTQDEAADIIRSVRTGGASSLYHSFDGGKTVATFKYYRIEPQTDTQKVREGFGFSVTRTLNGQDKTIKVGFTLASAERFSLFLQNALMRIFDAEYAMQKKAFEDRAKKQKDVPKQEDFTPEVVDESPEVAVDDDPFGL